LITINAQNVGRSSLLPAPLYAPIAVLNLWRKKMGNKISSKKKKGAPKKKKKKSTVSRKMSAREVIAYLKEKDKGKSNSTSGCLFEAGELYNTYDLRRPSGIPSLDLATGGGLPSGGLTQLTGPDSVGKNYLMYRYMANCQRIYGDRAAIVMACFEPTIDKAFARKAGLQLAYSNYEIALINKKRKSIKLPPLSAKDIAEMKKQLGSFLILRGLPEGVLDRLLFALKSNAFHIIGIDSWDAMLPAEDQNKQLTEAKKVADGPALETRFFRKFWAVLNMLDEEEKQNDTTIIGIRQVRANMSMWGREWKSVGSNAMKHAKLVDIELSQRAKLKKKVASKKDIQIGKTIAWTLAKGKMGCHEGLSGEYDFYFDGPRIDVEKDLVNLAIMNGIILRTGTWLTYRDIKKQGNEAMSRAIKDMNLGDEIFKAIKEKSGMDFRWK
jgi:RecA/RadA recombinase